MKTVAKKAPAEGIRFLPFLLSAVLLMTPFKGKGEVYQLPEVRVEETRYDVPLSVIHVERDREWELKDDVGEVIEEIQGIYVKEYGGKGGVKSPILRGADSQQTLLLLDGLKLLPRPYDLSVLPVDFFEEIEVYFSSPSTIYGADSIGGAINLKSDIAKKSGVKFSITGGSYSTIKVNGEGGARIGNLSASARGFYSTTSGDYVYLYQGEKRYISNNGGESYGLRTGIGGEGPFGRFSISILTFSRMKDVPGSIYAPTPDARQYDRFGCVVGSLFVPLNESTYITTSIGSSIYSMKYYDNIFISSLSPSTFDDLFFDGRSTVRWNKRRFSLEGGIEFYYQRRDGSSVGIHSFKNFSFQSGLTLLISRTLNLSTFVLHRTDFFNSFSQRTVFRGGFALDLRFLKLSTGAGTSYRVPTFNELYWKEDAFSKGNPELKPEKGVDVGTTLKVQVPEFPHISGEAGFSYIHMDDMILWDLWDGKWSPRNISTAHVYQTFLKLNFKVWNLKPSFMLVYTDTDSTRGELPYRPHWIMREEIAFDWRRFFAVISFAYTGNRYGSYWESGELPWYVIVSGNAGFTFNPFFVMFKVDYAICENETCMDSGGYPIPLYDVSLTLGIKTI